MGKGSWKEDDGSPVSVSGLKSNMDTEVKKHQKHVIFLRTEVTKLENRIKNLTKEIKEAYAARESKLNDWQNDLNNERANISQKVIAYNKSVEDLDKERKRFKAEKQDAENAQMSKDHQKASNLDKINKENDKLTARKIGLDDRENNLDTRENALNAAEKARDELEKSINNTLARVEQMKRDYDAKLQGVEDSKKVAEARNKLADDKNNEADIKLNQAKETLKEANEIKAEAQSVKFEADRVKEDNDRIKIELDNLNKKLQDWQDELIIENAATQSSKRRLEHLDRRVKEAASEISKKLKNK